MMYAVMSRERFDEAFARFARHYFRQPRHKIVVERGEDWYEALKKYELADVVRGMNDLIERDLARAAADPDHRPECPTIGTIKAAIRRTQDPATAPTYADCDTCDNHGTVALHRRGEDWMTDEQFRAQPVTARTISTAKTAFACRCPLGRRWREGFGDIPPLRSMDDVIRG